MYCAATRKETHIFKLSFYEWRFCKTPLFCNSSASMLCDQTWCVCAYSYCMSVCVPVCNWFSVHICSLSFISRTRLQLQPAGGKESYLKKSELHQVSKWRRGRMRARQGREGGDTTETEVQREGKWQDLKGKRRENITEVMREWGERMGEEQKVSCRVLLKQERCEGHRGGEMEI